MKTRTWIGMVMLLSLALMARAADTPGQQPGTPAPPPAPALEAPPAPALETPAPTAPAQETPSPLLVPETPARAVPPPSAPPPPTTVVNQPPRVAVQAGVPLSGSATIKEDRVNLRSRPLLNSEVVGQLGKGDQVEVMEAVSAESTKAGEPAHWIKVSLPKTNFVWVNSKFIDAATRTVSAPRLNVRSGPGENHDVLGRLDKGASIHELEVKGDWLRIQAPAGSYAFVAAHLLDKGAELAAQAKPTPPPASAPSANTAADSSTPVAVPAATEAAGVSTDVPPPTVTTTTPEVEAKPVDPQLIKRIVSREGIVRRTVSIQAPTEFALENSETRKMVNYLFNPAASGIVLRNFEGQRILVTGEELLDDRWPNTPVMNIEKVKARP